jgi:hypothetical protein
MPITPKVTTEKYIHTRKKNTRRRRKQRRDQSESIIREEVG